MNVTICGPNLFGVPETFHVHAAGCSDLGKQLYRGIREENWSTEASSQQDVIEAVYSDIIDENPDYGWDSYADEFKFFPCTKGLAAREPASQAV